MTQQEILTNIDERLHEVKQEIVTLEDARHALLGTKRRGRPPARETQTAPRRTSRRGA